MEIEGERDEGRERERDGGRGAMLTEEAWPRGGSSPS